MKEKQNYATPELKEFTVQTMRMIASSPTGGFESIGAGDSQTVSDEAF